MPAAPLVHPQFDPVALSVGPVAVHWYGLMYLIAFVGVLVMGRMRLAREDAKRAGIDARGLDDLLLYGVLGVVLGGRLGYVLFYKPVHYLAHPAEILAIWQGGMSFHGGLVGVIVALTLFAWRRGVPALSVTDFIAPLVPFGLAVGRLGNFLNGELWGRPADPAVIPWAMVFPQAGDAVARHPSQIYQLLLEGLLLMLLMFWFARRTRPVGAVSGFFLAGYAVLRFAAEFAREPDAFLGVLALGLTMGQWLCVPMLVAGVWLMAWAGRKDPSTRG